MSLWTVLLIGIGVSADAFAVSLARGLKIRKLHVSQALLIGGAFGLFQALMPIVGWLLGTAFAGLIQAVDHWVAFALLATASPWGWTAWACPALMLYFLLRVTGIPYTEAQSLRSRPEDYARYQRETSAFIPWFPKVP